MNFKTSYLVLSLMWTVVLVMDIVQLIAGESPTWVMTLCPLITLVVTDWLEYIGQSLKEN